MGTLSVGHAVIAAGDRAPRPRRQPIGLLGADLAWDGQWRIERVLRPDPTTPARAPLPAWAEGMCLAAIDGAAADGARPLSAALDGAEVTLTLDDCAGGGARAVAVTPLTRERDLRYSDWLRRTRAAVDAAGGGRLGYLHLPDMTTRGAAALERSFHGQRDREAWIVDLRWNGGGWLSDGAMDRLTRRQEAAFGWFGGAEESWPIRAAPPALVFLVNGHTMSEGEVLAAGARAAGLGPLVGAPTWGGLSSGGAGRRLIDGGWLSIPGVIWEDPADGRGLENRGVPPDVLVDGDDAQLEAAIREALARLGG